MIRSFISTLFGYCAHAGRPLLRRSPDGRMGLECQDCFRWTAIAMDKSRVALEIDARQQVEQWARQPREGFKIEGEQYAQESFRARGLRN